jgi:hypothetical protein
MGGKKIIDWSLLRLTHPSQMDKNLFPPLLVLQLRTLKLGVVLQNEEKQHLNIFEDVDLDNT